jgi:hypothetical protein
VGARTGIRRERRRPSAATVRRAALGAALVTLATASLRLSGEPHFDAFGWLVWGRQITTAPASLSTAVGPAWKPLPVLIAALLSPAGSAAPALWLICVRLAGAVAAVLAWRLAAAFGGWVAGVVAVVALASARGWGIDLSWGLSEPLVIALALYAILAARAGRHERAHLALVAAALCRVEVWPFLVAHAVWALRGGRLRRRLALASAVALPALWFGPDWYSTGDPFHQSVASRTSREALTTPHDLAGATRVVTRRALAVLPASVWILAAAGVAAGAWRRDRGVLALAGAALGWNAIVLALTTRGYAGLGRFTLPAAAIACALAGVGAAALLGAVRSPSARVALAVVLAALAGPGLAGWARANLRSAVRADGSAAMAALQRGVDHFGGPPGLLRFARVRVNGPLETALAWVRDGRIEPAHPGSAIFLTLEIGDDRFAGAPPRAGPGAVCSVARGPGWRAVVTASPRGHCSRARAARLSGAARSSAAGAPPCTRRPRRPARRAGAPSRAGRCDGPARAGSGGAASSGGHASRRS